MVRVKEQAVRRVLIGFVLLAALALLATVAVLGPGRLIASVRLLSDVVSAMQAPAEGPDVRREQVIYAAGGVMRRADLYRPLADKGAPLVLVPGATPAGTDDSRLVAFAGALSRAGFLVLVPELAGSDPVRVSAEDAIPIADAVGFLAEETVAERIGLAAISYAAGPALIATREPLVRDKIGLFLAIGPYYDIEAAVTYLLTGAYREGTGQPWRTGRVDARAKWRFLLANADRVDPEDAATLRRIARIKLQAPKADVAEQVSRLGPNGRAAWGMISAADPDRVAERLAQIPRDLRRAIGALDLEGRVLDLSEAGVILIHGRDDPMIPYTESLALARAVTARTVDVFMLKSLFHVDLMAVEPADAFTMGRIAYRLLAERDRLIEERK